MKHKQTVKVSMRGTPHSRLESSLKDETPTKVIVKKD